MTKTVWTLALLLLGLTPFAEPAPILVGGGQAGVLGLRIADIDGRIHRLGMTDHGGATAFVFLDTTCPIANRYAPALNELATEAERLGVAFFGVHSDPATSPERARAHRDEYALGFSILFDSSGELAARLRPTHVPEAFVYDASDALLYRGRIDNRFEAIGKMRAKVTVHDLRAALEAASGSSEREPWRSDPVGCVFEAWDHVDDEAEVSYTRDVAPILNANCIECHRTGDIAPFALDDYESARRRARTIALVCAERTMPPWRAEPGFGHFRDERVLSERQIEILAAWADAGAPEGDAEQALPAPETPTTRWRLGEPDLLVSLPVEFEVPAAGDDIYRYFVVPSELTEDRVIVATDFRPGDPSVVHHCIAYLDRTGWARQMDEEFDGPGFAVFRADGDPGEFEGRLLSSQQVAGWAPGTLPYELPEGVGMRLGAGGDFILEVHYHLNGKATTDRSSLALYFADEPVERYAEVLLIGTEQIDIDAGAPAYDRHVWMNVPSDIELVDVSPHMHYVGKSVEAMATLPDGSLVPLIKINDWDFRWQGAYVYREPVRLPKGSRIDAFFRFDNSAENPFNPSSPPQRIVEGWRTTDEMCLFYMTAVPADPAELGNLRREMFASFGRPAGL